MAEQIEKEQRALDAGRTPEEENRKESEPALSEAKQEPGMAQTAPEEGPALKEAEQNPGTAQTAPEEEPAVRKAGQEPKSQQAEAEEGQALKEAEQNAGTVQTAPGEELTAGKSAEKRKAARRRINFIRRAVGAVLILTGLGVCAYPVVRQAQSRDFNKDAIDMILTPQPTKPAQPTQTAAPTQAEGSREPALTGEGTPQNVPDSPAPTQAEGNGGNVGGNTEAPDESDPTPAGGGETEENLTGEPAPTQRPDNPGQEADANKPNRLNNRTVIGVIQIEAIDLIYAIVEGTETEDIGVAIGHMSDTAGLGEIGNCALAGHRGGYSGPYFKDIDKLKKGDSVVITKAGGQSFKYKVTESFIVEPTEIWVVEDTGEDKAVLTLVTCEDNGETRLIVRCELEE